MIHAAASAWADREVFAALRATLCVFTPGVRVGALPLPQGADSCFSLFPQTYPRVFLWAGFPLGSMSRLLWRHNLRLIQDEGESYSVPHGEVELHANLDRCINYHQTGDASVLKHRLMDATFCALAVLVDGPACFNPQLIEFVFDSVLDIFYPILIVDALPVEGDGYDFDLVSRTAQEYTLGPVHYQVSFRADPPTRSPD